MVGSQIERCLGEEVLNRQSKQGLECIVDFVRFELDFESCWFHILLTYNVSHRDESNCEFVDHTRHDQVSLTMVRYPSECVSRDCRR